MKKISIIVPIYNVEKYIDTCINSIVTQTYKKLEIILVDDGSTDNCSIICDEWAKRDNRIKVIHKENGGVADARNRGLEIATGDYIGFVDSDDIISLDMYKILVELLEGNDADVSVCQEDRFEKGKDPNFSVKDKEYVINGSNEILKSLFSKSLIKNYLWNKLYKRELLDNIVFPVGQVFEDKYVMHKILLKANRCVITTSRLYGYMQRTDSYVLSYAKELVIQHIDVINTRYNELKDNIDILDCLNISRMRDIYWCFAQATNALDKEFYNSKMLLDEYRFLRKTINLKNFKDYLSSSNKRIEALKIILLIDRKLFWIIRTKK